MGTSVCLEQRAVQDLLASRGLERVARAQMPSLPMPLVYVLNDLWKHDRYAHYPQVPDVAVLQGSYRVCIEEIVRQKFQAERAGAGRIHNFAIFHQGPIAYFACAGDELRLIRSYAGDEKQRALVVTPDLCFSANPWVLSHPEFIQ